ncbi:MAG: TolC family protein [Microscillaceae bacterium]|nr:TolC family protein [Microscillaceae bacterium]
MKTNIYLFILAFGIMLLMQAPGLSAQTRFKVEEAVQKALAQNLALQVRKMDTLISLNDITLGNAGFLPTLSLEGRVNGSFTNTRQEFLDGRSQSVNGAKNSQQFGGLRMNWILFDGMRMFYNYEALKQSHAFTQTNILLEIENVLANTLNNYYTLGQQEQTRTLLNQNLEVSRQRRSIARDRYELGAFSRADYLRAQVDFNTDSAQVILQDQFILASRARLNQWMGQSPDTPLPPTDSLAEVPLLRYEAWKEKVEAQNVQLRAERQSLALRQTDVLLSKSNRWPTLSLDLGYDALNSRSDAGFLRSNRNYGLNYALNLSVPIFDGDNRRRQQENAQMRLEQAQANLENIGLIAQTDFEVAFQSYVQQKALYDLEANNVDLVRQNLDIAIERYKLGGMSALEFRDAQLLALQAENRLIVLRYQMKLLEIEIRRVSGDLVQAQ